VRRGRTGAARTNWWAADRDEDLHFHRGLIERNREDPTRLTGAGFVEVGPCGTEEYRGEVVTVIAYELPDALPR
jgi:hypothetical protein